MAKLGSIIALKKLLTSEDYLLIWLKAGYTKEERSRFKYRLDNDQLTLDKIEEVLERCGFTVAQEKLWNTPNLN